MISFRKFAYHKIIFILDKTKISWNIVKKKDVLTLIKIFKNIIVLMTKYVLNLL